MAAVLQIRQVVLVAVGLLLEPDAVVGLEAVAMLRTQHQPLQHIPHKERQEQQLALLRRMYALMVHLLWRQFTPRKHKSAQVYGRKLTAPRVSPYPYYLHRSKNLFKPSENLF